MDAVASSEPRKLEKREWMDGVRAAQPTSPVTQLLGISSAPCGVSSEGAGVTEEGLLP